MEVHRQARFTRHRLSTLALAWYGAVAGLAAHAWEIPVSHPIVQGGLSPYQWVVAPDVIHSSVSGASLTLGFRGTQNVALKVTTSHLTKSPADCYPVLAWSIHGGAVNTHSLVAGETSIPLATGIPDPVIDLYIKGMSPMENRWTGDAPENSVRIRGFEVDEGASPVAVQMPKKIWLNIGDSILSGDGAAYAPSQGRPPNDGWAAASDSRASYGYLLARHFGYRESRIAYGGYNWAGGMAGVPALPKLIDYSTSTRSRLTHGRLHPAPDVVLVNLGENGVPQESDVVSALQHLRRRTGNQTTMLVMTPVSEKGSTEIKRAWEKYRSGSNDKKSFLIHLGKINFDTADGQHPTASGHQQIFESARRACGDILAETEESPHPTSHALGEPFWSAHIMRNEPMLFVQGDGDVTASGKLLFHPSENLRITSPDGTITYENGKDYVWKPGADTVTLRAGSRIPFKTAAEMMPPGGGPNTFHGVLFSEGHYFHALQVQATYQHKEKWDWQPPPNENRLTRTLAKLKAKQPIRIVALGDSITEGYNASGFSKVNVPPYQPAYPELVALDLQHRFGAPVTLTNLGVGGKRAEWGMGEVKKITAQKPDLVILAFGMNHTEPGSAFGLAMTKLLAAIQAGSPSTDVVLVSPMAGNPRIFPTERFTSYREALRAMQSPTVALADITTPWLEILKRKPFADLSGNHVNHPNDFSHRLYAQVICHHFPTNPVPNRSPR